MDALTAILTRRSIRRFKAKPVTSEVVTELLKASMNAPSAGNEQPWHFIVLTDRRSSTRSPVPSLLGHAEAGVGCRAGLR